MTDKPNTRPWDDPEDNDAEDEAMLEWLYGRYPRMQENMVFYANIMERGASFAITMAGWLHWLCMAFIQLHIRTPRWVWRVGFIALCFLTGFAVTTGITWLAVSLP